MSQSATTTRRKKAVTPAPVEATSSGASSGASSRPIDERYSLFDYQRQTIEDMQRAEADNSIRRDIFEFSSSFGINANSFGSGKTRTTLRLIEDNKLTFESTDVLTVKKFSCRTEYLDTIRTIVNIRHKNFYEENLGVPVAEQDEEERPKLVFKKINATLIGMDKKLIGEWEKEARAVGFSDYLVIQVPSDVLPGKIQQIAPILTDPDNTTKTLLIGMNLYGDFIRELGHHFKLDSCVSSYCLLWKRMIFDDLHATTRCSAVTTAPRCAALFTWFLNATPELMHSRMQYVAANHLNVTNPCPENAHLIKVQVPSDVYVPPELRVENHYFKEARILQALENVIPAEVREMFVTGDHDGAYHRLMNKLDAEPSAVSDRKPIHEIVIQKMKTELKKLKEEERRALQYGWNIQHTQARVAEVERKIHATVERVKQALETSECPICMDTCERQQITMTKCCSNAFCRSCMGDLFKNAQKVPCPLCRHENTLKDLYVFDDHGNAMDVQELASGTLRNRSTDNMPNNFQQILERLLLERPNGKILVYAPYERTSDTIKLFLKDGPIRYGELTGVTAVGVAKRLEQFRTGEFQVLFLNSRTANSGFNLQYATDIIIIGGHRFDLESPAVQQIVSRVARFPRTEEVPVHVIQPLSDYE